MATGDVGAMLDDADPMTVARWGVPVALGVLTWLAVAVPVGTVLGGPSFTTVIALVVGGMLAIPVYRTRPWERGFTRRGVALLVDNRRALAVAVALFVAVRLPVVSDLLAPVFGIVLLPMRAFPPALKRAATAYADPLGAVLFDLGRWYVELLWLSVIGGGVAKLFPEGDG